VGYEADLSGVAYGTICFPLQLNHHDENDCDYERENYRYTCRNCGYPLNYDWLREEGEAQVEERRREQAQRNIHNIPITPRGRHINTERGGWNFPRDLHHGSSPPGTSDGEGQAIFNLVSHQRWNPAAVQSENIIECPNCSHVFSDQQSAILICPRCDKQWENTNNIATETMEIIGATENTTIGRTAAEILTFQRQEISNQILEDLLGI
jgi:hypothetical protein